MQHQKHCLDGEWPDFDCLGELFDWLDEQRDLKVAQCASRESSETFQDAAQSLSESLPDA
jgi:hypothetical protein